MKRSTWCWSTSLRPTWRVCYLRDQERETERERSLLPGTVPVRLRACAYASELSFYLISAAAATLSRRLARLHVLLSLSLSRQLHTSTSLPFAPFLAHRLFHFVLLLSLFSFPSFLRLFLFFPIPSISRCDPLSLSLFFYFSFFYPVSFFLNIFSLVSPSRFPRTPRLSTINSRLACCQF